MPRASAADAAETARRILEIATTVFASDGYAAASVDQIAATAGVTRGAVYHHYRSKPQLFAAVAAAQQRRVAEAIAAATTDRTSDAALRDGSHVFLDAITTKDAARVLLVDGPSVLDWDTWRRLDAEGPEQELRAGLRDAGASAALLDPLTAALSGAMNELALWLASRPDEASKRQAHRALDVLLDAASPTAETGSAPKTPGHE